MNRTSVRLLQAVSVLVGLGAAFLLLWEPHLEGRNAQATAFEIYFNDPFLAGAYVASIPFFLALYQVFKILGRAGRDEDWRRYSAKPLRIIRYCAITVIGFVAVGEVAILSNDSDDRAGGVFMGALIALVFMIVAASALAIERALQKTAA